MTISIIGSGIISQGISEGIGVFLLEYNPDFILVNNHNNMLYNLSIKESDFFAAGGIFSKTIFGRNTSCCL